ncbi:SA1362 family protein [Oceanobacillus halotolerans]|uniref:SA1362 family protein n=1 Tax=Oceanobacillus halotolerans TaxID=2663380 RepID=UPI0013DB8A32|nr:SA1362 family protein [Oceanobacillus halotolerans]
MARSKLSILVYVIIGLAAIGLFSQLINNTANFMMNIAIMIGFGVLISAVIYFIFIRNRRNTSDMKKYKQAVKQSKLKYKQHKNENPASAKRQQTMPIKKRLNKRASHLRVIDGNKSKRKNRATF